MQSSAPTVTTSSCAGAMLPERIEIRNEIEMQLAAADLENVDQGWESWSAR